MGVMEGGSGTLNRGTLNRGTRGVERDATVRATLREMSLLHLLQFADSLTLTMGEI